MYALKHSVNTKKTEKRGQHWGSLSLWYLFGLRSEYIDEQIVFVPQLLIKLSYSFVFIGRKRKAMHMFGAF